jgi:hypothetical protein
MGLDTKTYWLTDRQSQCNFDFDFDFTSNPCGGGVEYLHRDPASRRRRRKGKSQNWDSKILSRDPRDSDPRKTALAVPKFQGKSSVTRRRIRRLSVRCYMCCSTSISGVCNLVRLLQFFCYKSVTRKRIVKTSGNRPRRLMWSDCKLVKSDKV